MTCPNCGHYCNNNTIFCLPPKPEPPPNRIIKEEFDMKPFLIMVIAVVLTVVCLTSCAAPGANKVQADFYECGEPPNQVLFICKTGTGPPRTDCTGTGSGETTLDPITC